MDEKITSQQLLGYNLKASRTFLGLSQMKLAEMCNLSTNFISELEGGKAWVSAETLDKIALVLGVGPDALFRSQVRAESEPLETALSACIRIFEDHSNTALTEIRKELSKVRR